MAKEEALEAAHAVFSPSSAHRWTVCTASAAAIAAMERVVPQEEGEAAAEGTRAHLELERVMGGGEPDPDHPAAYAVALAIAYANGLPPGQMWIEQRVILTEHIWGRCDIGHWHPETATLTIVDLKNGFVGVDAEENEQLRIYAAALIRTFNLPARWIRYTICQPNDFRPNVPRVKQWVEPVADLLVFAERVSAIPNGPLTFVAGEQCKYCPLFGRCPASQDVLMQVNVVLASMPNEIPLHQRALIKACQKPILDWFKAADKAWTTDALKGQIPTGMKIVATAKHRAWKDEAVAKEFVFAQKGLEGLSPPSPAQAEAMGIDISGMAETPDGGPALVFENDKRKPFTRKSATEMFAEVTSATTT